MSDFSSRVKAFFAASAVFAGLLISLCQIDEVRSWMLSNLLVSGIASLCAEAAIAYLSFFGIKTQPGSPLNARGDYIREKIAGRFADTIDFAGISAIFSSHFPDEVAIDDEEYCQLLARRKFTRLIEEFGFADTGEFRRVIGYYSVWPITKGTFETLRNGTIHEWDIRSADVLDPDDPNAYIIYIPEICQATESDIGIALMNDMRRYIAHLVEANDAIFGVAAWPYTKVGLKLVEDSGFKACDERNPKNSIYEVSKVRLAGLRRPSGLFEESWERSF